MRLTSKKWRVGWFSILIGMLLMVNTTGLSAQGGDATLGGIDPEDIVHYPGGVPLPPVGGPGNLGVIQGQGPLPYYYGGGNWPEMTAAIDSACNTVTVLPDATDLTAMLQHDGLWLDQRWTAGSLSATEASNLADYIATGRPVVMIGENASWTSWNNQILGLVGGSHAGEADGPQDVTGGSALINGVTQVNVSAAGVAAGGSPLFVNNWSTEFGANVVTILEVNAQSQNWNDLDNATFFNNVASWVCSGSAPVPTTPDWSKGALLLLLLLGSLGVLYRYREAR